MRVNKPGECKSYHSRKGGIETIVDLCRNFFDVKIIALCGDDLIDPSGDLFLAKLLVAHRTFSKQFKIWEMLEAVRDLLGQR